MSAVLPSFLSLSDSGDERTGYLLGVDDPYLRVGRVSKLHKPTDDSNHSKKFIEYDVEIDLWEASGSYTRIVYPRARMGSLFGAVADFTSHTPRIVTDQPNQINQGSLVLVLCVNGDTRQSIIIGGIQHPGLPQENPDRDGHNYESEFNGAKLTINKDGELTITFRGATNADGTLTDNADPDAEGANLGFTKDGSVNLETKSGTQHLQFDRPNGNAHLQADNEVRVKTQATVIESDSTKIGGDDANDALVMGTTYRNAESMMNQQLQQQFQTLTQLLIQAGTQLTSAGGAMSAPIVGAVTAGPIIAATGAILVAAATLTETMSVAIQSFEAQAPTYISKKNTTD